MLSDGATGKVAFDDNGDRIYAEYDIINIQENGERISVGQYFYPAVSERKRNYALKNIKTALLF